mmetsp:Transcript_14863/g.47733  ORF Transcript_14863/g.47733 Transcript_14863/m.47733 type:complete len:229 (-) Transcript_14863:194-880(-)
MSKYIRRRRLRSPNLPRWSMSAVSAASASASILASAARAAFSLRVACAAAFAAAFAAASSRAPRRAAAMFPTSSSSSSPLAPPAVSGAVFARLPLTERCAADCSTDSARAASFVASRSISPAPSNIGRASAIESKTSCPPMTRGGGCSARDRRRASCAAGSWHSAPSASHSLSYSPRASSATSSRRSRACRRWNLARALAASASTSTSSESSYIASKRLTSVLAGSAS